MSNPSGATAQTEDALFPFDEKSRARLAEPYPLEAATIERFRADGFVKLPDVLAPDLLARYRDIVTGAVRRIDDNPLPLAERDTYGRAFTQTFNLWREDARIDALMRSTRLARIAAELMGVQGVRLYHDQALFKEAGGGHTPWHCDQVYWPLSTDNSVTAWIPLQPVDMPMGPLAFSPGSHRIEAGRDLAISDESEAQMGRLLSERPMVEEPFELGDISFHSGWTFHRAGANATAEARAVFTIIYVERNIRLIEPTTDPRRNDARSWAPGVRPGEVLASRINPILYES